MAPKGNGILLAVSIADGAKSNSVLRQTIPPICRHQVGLGFGQQVTTVMQDTSDLDLIEDSARRLFSRHNPVAGAEDIWLGNLWDETESAGFGLALLSEEQGGFGFSPNEALAPVRIAAEYAVPLPLGETVLANWLLAEVGLDPIEGPVGIASRNAAQAFGRHLGAVVSIAPDSQQLVIQRPAPGDWLQGTNIAGEPYDNLRPGTAEYLAMAPAPLSADTLRAVLAGLRAVQMAGAMRRILEMTLQYAGEREQFGRPLSRFQAIQQNCAIMGSHVAAANTAAEMVTTALPQALFDPDRYSILAAAAKVRVGEAAAVVAGLAHQVHGAMGFSHEYPLHPLTRRLWAWRDEHGTETDWASHLAATAIRQPERGFWPYITALHEDAT